MKIHEGRARSFHAEPGSEDAEPGSYAPRGRSWGVFALIIIALLLVASFVFLMPYLPGLLMRASSTLFSDTSSTQTTGTGSTEFMIYSPLIQNGAANITYPVEYQTFASYAVRLINDDRGNHSLSPVVLGTNGAGQQHADSMLKFGYFSHNDTQGYKPYERYALLGGLGAVSENVAYISWNVHYYDSIGKVEDSIQTLQFAMVNNDSACCNNGHRENILNPLHNRVAIGIAYNSTTLYFVEDFENYYVDLNFSVSPDCTVSTCLVSMEGTLLNQNLRSTSAYITYDGTPSPQTPSQLNSGAREYTPGTFLGGVMPPCNIFCPAFVSGITVHATTWQFSSHVDIVFSLADFINQRHQGVYNIYIITGNDTSTAVTSISVFVG